MSVVKNYRKWKSDRFISKTKRQNHTVSILLPVVESTAEFGFVWLSEVKVNHFNVYHAKLYELHKNRSEVSIWAVTKTSKSSYVKVGRIIRMETNSNGVSLAQVHVPSKFQFSRIVEIPNEFGLNPNKYVLERC